MRAHFRDGERFGRNVGRDEGAAIAAGIIALGLWGQRMAARQADETCHRCRVGYRVSYSRSRCPYCSERDIP